MIGSVPLHIIKEVSTLNLSLGNSVPNQEIASLLENTLLLGGKRFRPLLTFLMSEFFELNLKEMGLFARAIEMTHSATLAHDDVIDEAIERRGKPSINMASTNKKAILSGDYLLAQTMLELSQTGDIRFIQELSKVLRDLVDGEWLQMKNKINAFTTREAVEEVALKKTASAITWCCVVPAMKAGQTDQIISLCREFGQSLGLAFQEIDDVIDFQSSSMKDQFQDIKNDIINSVLFELFELAPETKAKLVSNPDRIQELAEQDVFKQALKNVQTKAQNRIIYCKELLNKIQGLTFNRNSKRSNKAHQTLNTLLDALAHREH